MKEHKIEWLEDSTVVDDRRYEVKLVDGKVTIGARHIYYFNTSRFGSESVEIKREALPWLIERLRECLNTIEVKE